MTIGEIPSIYEFNLVDLFASTGLLQCQVCNPRVKIVTVVCRCLAFFVVSVLLFIIRVVSLGCDLDQV